MSEGCRITQVGREPQEVSSATSCPKYKRLGQTKRCRTSPRCALKSHSALSFIPDNSAGNVDGGITLTRQVVTTQGQEWGRDLGVQVFEKWGEREETAGTGAGREHKPLRASHGPAQPHTPPVTAATKEFNQIIP